ncbi:MAG TPA: hypothetical protein VJ698_18460 [Noviherbaspirillum sp.]|uniref:hypothetical protein n=1 Tax=Noviherbaspirillum sp. TaxID=1926288 RepID=UPI002B47290C|nr:hypothetical protein [Noviherbaspirillum sp.]HJV87458.1 hypothetical protein [Noviherbaspirillum sp.]
MMNNEKQREGSGSSRRPIARTALLAGVAGGLAALAVLSVRTQMRSRRYGDRTSERRNPVNFFLAGPYPHRRAIDVSGRRPLFERRQSVYDTY